MEMNNTGFQCQKEKSNGNQMWYWKMEQRIRGEINVKRVHTMKQRVRDWPCGGSSKCFNTYIFSIVKGWLSQHYFFQNNFYNHFWTPLPEHFAIAHTWQWTRFRLLSRCYTNVWIVKKLSILNNRPYFLIHAVKWFLPPREEQYVILCLVWTLKRLTFQW